MDNRLFIRKCFICGEPATDENPIEYFNFISEDGDNDCVKECHEKCWEKKENNETKG